MQLFIFRDITFLEIARLALASSQKLDEKGKNNSNSHATLLKNDRQKDSNPIEYMFNTPRKKFPHLQYPSFNFIFSLAALFFSTLSATAQNHSIILGRPTDTSITASVMFDQRMEFILEYGTQSGQYVSFSKTRIAEINTPDEADLVGLSPNTRYFYRMKYRAVGSSNYTYTPEYTFHTQRAQGSAFTFTIEADEHLYDKKGDRNTYSVTLANQAADKPDFMLSLGDIFGDDHEPYTITSAELDLLHRDYRPYLGQLCHSVPFFVCLGNHEGENDYYMSLNAPNNLCIWGTQWRKFYYPNPYPNGFYSGNTTNEPHGIGNPENYYAWTWGDALFVVLDVYRDQCDTSAQPGGWNWTLGLPQYTWLKSTLEGSKAKYKFVFAHHIRGLGRGGVTNAKLFEWGGYDGQGGTRYNFNNKRPGWGKPIHQLFVDNGVNIFFQGHDHVFAHEVMDGITYQAVPMAADSSYEIGMLANADAYVSDTIDGIGHLRVSVTDACVTVDYIKAFLPKDTVGGKNKNREVAFSYTLGTCNTSMQKTISKDRELRVFPNPSDKQIQVQFMEPVYSCKLELTNAAGQLVASSNTTEIATENIQSGMYILTVSALEKKWHKNIIIQHDNE